MDLASSKVYRSIIASVEEPIRHFIETGFWSDAHSGENEYAIGSDQVRRACRQLAIELKRPFILCGASYGTYEHRDTGKKDQHGFAVYERVNYDAPRFGHGWVEMPRRKYLLPLVSPLFLLPTGRKYYQRIDDSNSAAGFDMSTPTLWQFRIDSEELWNNYYNFVLNDPDCRKARRLTS